MNKGSNKHSNKKGSVKCGTNEFTMGLPSECPISTSKNSMNGFVNGISEEKKTSHSKASRKERKNSKHTEKKLHVKDTYLENTKINKSTINEENGSIEIAEIPNTVSDSTTSTKCRESTVNSTDILIDNFLHSETLSSCSKSSLHCDKRKESGEDNVCIKNQNDANVTVNLGSGVSLSEDKELQLQTDNAIASVLNLNASNRDQMSIDLGVDVTSNSEDLIADFMGCSLNTSDCANTTLTEETAELKISSTAVCTTSGQDNSAVQPIEYVQYQSELQMPMIMKLIQKDLSEPYSIYTYRYFIHNWPKLCFLVRFM